MREAELERQKFLAREEKERQAEALRLKELELQRQAEALNAQASLKVTQALPLPPPLHQPPLPPPLHSSLLETLCCKPCICGLKVSCGVLTSKLPANCHL